MIQSPRIWFASLSFWNKVLCALLVMLVAFTFAMFALTVVMVFTNSEEPSSNGPKRSQTATEGLAQQDAQELAVMRMWAPPRCATPTTQPITAPVPLGPSADELRSAGWKPVRHIIRPEAAIGDFVDKRAEYVVNGCTSIDEARAIALADLGLEAELEDSGFIVWQAPASLENPTDPAVKVYLSTHSSNFAFATVDTGDQAAKAIIIVPTAPISAANLSSPDFAAAVDAAAQDLRSPGTGTSVPVNLVSPSGEVLGIVNLWVTEGVR